MPFPFSGDEERNTSALVRYLLTTFPLEASPKPVVPGVRLDLVDNSDADVGHLRLRGAAIHSPMIGLAPATICDLAHKLGARDNV